MYIMHKNMFFGLSRISSNYSKNVKTRLFSFGSYCIYFSTNLYNKRD